MAVVHTQSSRIILSCGAEKIRARGYIFMHAGYCGSGDGVGWFASLCVARTLMGDEKGKPQHPRV